MTLKIGLSIMLGMVTAALITPFMLFAANAAGVPIGPTLGPIIVFGTMAICVMAATALVYGGTYDAKDEARRASAPRASQGAPEESR